MAIVAVRSVTLSTDTAQAWKNYGVTFARRDRSPDSVMRMGFHTVINLGNSNFNPEPYEGVKLWNKGNHIRPITRPGTTRQLMGDLMPEVPTHINQPIWVKAPGAGGRGNSKQYLDKLPKLPMGWDMQVHVEGQEYRLITVGKKVIQDFLRYGRDPDREYKWLPMKDVPKPIKRLARDAASRLEGDNVIAWDLIETHDGVLLFEGNSCPGVAEYTVARIINAMEATNE